MPIPDPDKIWPKLEKDGVEEVKKKLSMGVYASFKIPVIEEWLRNKEIDTSKQEAAVQRQKIDKAQQELSAHHQEKESRVDQFFKWAKNHRVISVVIILFMIIIALGSLTDAVSKISKFFNFEKKQIEIKGVSNGEKRLEPIIIPVHIESKWDEYSELDRKAEFFIVRAKTPATQVVVYSGSARVEIPKGGLTVNEWISISPHKTTKTIVSLPKSEVLYKYLDEGGYEIQLVLFNKYGRIFSHVEQKLFDREILKRGMSYWFRFISYKNPNE